MFYLKNAGLVNDTFKNHNIFCTSVCEIDIEESELIISCILFV